MKTLLLPALLLGSLVLFVPAHDVVAPPAQVRFDSVDFKNILHWNINVSSSQFYVQWKIYGERQWVDVDGCQGISEHHCDLSRLTSSINEWYYARVRAAASSSTNSSTWSSSSRFSPRWDTKISPPTLKLNVTKQGIVVWVKKPPRVLLRRTHNNLFYKVYLTHSSGDEEVFELSSYYTKHTLSNVTRMTQYCLQAQTVIRLQSKRSPRSPPLCVTTP